MVDRTHDDEALRSLLATPRRIAVVGASPNPSRDSHRVFRFLLDHGHDVVPVNPVADEVAGVACVPSLAAARDHWGAPPDIVDVFRASEHVPSILEESLAVNATWLWLQLGVLHEEARDQAIAAGMEVVMDRCIKVELARLVS